MIYKFQNYEFYLQLSKWSLIGQSLSTQSLIGQCGSQEFQNVICRQKSAFFTLEGGALVWHTPCESETPSYYLSHYPTSNQTSRITS